VLLLLPAVMSFYVEQANNFVGTYFSTRLETGAISVLGYSHKLSMVILSVFLVYLTASLFPRIANLTSSGMSDGLSGFLSRTLRVVVLVATPAIAYTLYYASEVVGVLFERGSFTRENTLQVASVFSILLVAIPFTLVRDIMNRVFFSFSDTKTPVMVTTGAFVINVAMCFWFHMRLGLTGIALSISASTMVNSIAIAWLAQRRVEVPLWQRQSLSCCCMLSTGSSVRFGSSSGCHLSSHICSY
jgi:putative peptidoglycan lipid II flippase